MEACMGGAKNKRLPSHRNVFLKFLQVELSGLHINFHGPDTFWAYGSPSTIMHFMGAKTFLFL